MGRTVYRIEALKYFSDVKKGDLGGWIENGYNLSQNGDCWIYNDAKVLDRARISDNAIVSGATVVFEDAEVYGDAEIHGPSLIFGNSIVIDSKVTGSGFYSKVLIIPKDHPDFWDYTLEHPELKVICLDK